MNDKYNKNIKPAPSPYYTLSKFMGNLSINEYRSLCEYEKLICYFFEMLKTM